MAAHIKPIWKRVLTARYLRWYLAACAVRLFPRLGRWLGFFPDHIGMIEAADQVIADTRTPVDLAAMGTDMAHLERCREIDSKAADCTYPDGVYEGVQTVLIRNAWIDMATSAPLLPERGRMVLQRGAFANWNATSVRPARNRVHIPGRVFAPYPTRNYFHMVVENGLRILEVAEMPALGGTPFTLATPVPQTRVAHALYEGMANLFPHMSVIETTPHALVIPDEVLCHFPVNNHWEWPSIDRRSADRLGEAFETVYDTPRTFDGERLYLSRKGARDRTLFNEDALIERLSARGFETFVASDSNHPEQIARFRSARVIVSPHGAGLTNLIFSQPGARVIEIFPENFAKSPYWWLSTRLGLDYIPVFGGPGDYHLRFDVDIDRVLAAIGE